MGKERPVPTEYASGRGQSRAVTLGGGGESLALSEIETRLLGRPDRSLVTIPSGVSWLPYRGCSCANEDWEPPWTSLKVTPTIRSSK